MPHIYEVPTHLQVEDGLIAGLSPKQLLRLLAGGSVAYGIWDQALILPPTARLVLALLVAAAGLLMTLWHPGGRPLDQWLFAAASYAVVPRRWSWRLSHEGQLRRDARDGAEWVELAPDVDWASAAGHDRKSGGLGAARRNRGLR